jgi:predicted peptidase
MGRPTTKTEQEDRIVMTKITLAVLGVVLLRTPALADTGFLDRTLEMGTVSYRYQVYVPADHTRQKSWPVIVDLHGNGSQGSDGLLPTLRGLADQIRLDRSRFPLIALFPQAAVGKRWFDADMEELVIAELDRTMKEFGGDPARVYLTGFSMGATGAYRIAYRWPARFAALVAIAGRVDTSDAKTYSDRDKQADRTANPFVSMADPFAALAAKISHLPIRLFHGDRDESVPVEQSRRLVPALKSARAAVRYDEYAGADHVGAAQKAYADEGLYTWLLAQHR